MANPEPPPNPSLASRGANSDRISLESALGILPSGRYTYGLRAPPRSAHGDAGCVLATVSKEPETELDISP